jgi:crotonobetainyl-CoA:carnitine CoA-transferase CaiB-like acyl-CoA transferase
MSVTGERDDLPGGGPQRTGVPIVDLFTGMYATVSILAALHHRDATGEGQRIDVSLLDVVLALSSGQLSNFLVSGKVPGRVGNVSPNLTPYEVFACADGQMIIAAGNQTQFVSLCQAIGHLEWAKDERFCSNEARLQHRDELHARLEQVFRAHSGTEWEDLLFAAGVPCGPINDYAQALAHPQARFHQVRIDTPHALGVRVPGIASPMRFSATPVEYRQAPPLLGQHTREVLTEQLGLTAAELERLEAGRVIACAKQGSALWNV